MALIDQEAKGDEIVLRLRELLTRAGRYDTVFVFLSGHGFRQGRDAYFMPYDTKLRLLNRHGIHLEKTFARELRECGADHKFLVLDCCHSGGATGKAWGERASLSDEDLTRLSGR